MTQDTVEQKMPRDDRQYEDDEINLLDLWNVIWRNRKLIGRIIIVVTVATAIISLFMTNIYEAKAVITPVSAKESKGGGLSALAQQFGGLAGIAGVALPSPASATEIVNLLKSNILREKIIEKYQLLPILFPDQWDEEKKDWKRGGITLNPLALLQMVRRAMSPGKAKGIKKEEGVPDLWDGLRELENIVEVKHNVKENIITITVNFEDPELAAKMVEFFLSTLNDHMSNEAKRVATINRKYLEQQLGETTDHLIKQKIYNLIAEQIETSMMAEVKENFAFKVIDPPKVPDRKVKPKRTLMVILAFIMSAFVGVFVVFFKEYLEKMKAQSAGGTRAG